MEQLVNLLRRDHPGLQFVLGSKASWAPATMQVTYTSENTDTAIWTMLHELGHALLGHTTYASDLHLLRIETAAWEKAVILAEQYKVSPIHNDHIQDCLDTYRDWLHKRSACPTCGDHGIQPTEHLYHCLNCQNTWKVSSARFCRPYRLKTAQTA
jgi:hypothetical protein